MKLFAGEWIQSVLERLGMTEDEAIESPMVSRRIKQAQQKIEGRAFGDTVAGSAAEWLERNIPSGN